MVLTKLIFTWSVVQHTRKNIHKKIIILNFLPFKNYLYILLRPCDLIWGHYILVNFSETIHVTVLSLDVLYRAHSGLFRDIISICLIFKLCVINQHLRKMLWGFKSKYGFLLRNRTLISYTSSYEDTGTKSMFITHFGRHNKWIGK